jgi:hypothetical protein
LQHWNAQWRHIQSLLWGADSRHGKRNTSKPSIQSRRSPHGLHITGNKATTQEFGLGSVCLGNDFWTDASGIA